MSTALVNMVAAKTVSDLTAAVLPLLWVTLAIVKLINTICGIVWATSTMEGAPFRLRLALPQLLAPLLILRALSIVTGQLGTAPPAKQVLYLLKGLRYVLMPAHYAIS